MKKKIPTKKEPGATIPLTTVEDPVVGDTRQLTPPGDTRHSSPAFYQPRTYRNKIHKTGLTSFRVVVKETDLHIQADRRLEEYTRERILYHREIVENYIRSFPEFATTLSPWPGEAPRPALIEDMIRAGRRCGVGPMAAVAGAIAACVGNDLLMHSTAVIVENGGDVFMKTRETLTIAIHAGDSPLSSKIGIRTGGHDSPMAVCTSSGTVGHSLSFGRADAVCVVSSSCALADAAATAIGNHVGAGDDIKSAIEIGKIIEGVEGVVIIAGDKMGAWGPLELVPLSGKKG